MPHLMLYGSGLRGYTPYAHGLRSDPPECIILWIARKRKLTNRLSYSEHWINFYIIYYPLYMLIMQVYHDYGRMRDFGRKIWLRSYIPTPVALLTLVDVTTLDISPDFDCASWLSRWARCLSYHLSCERHRMAGLDDCNILQLRHLVRNRLGGTHDSISVQNLRAHSFTCRSSHAMCHTTKEHLTCRDLRKNWVFRGTRYPTTLEDQSLRMSSQVRT
jgi:hypothetical protein